MNIFKKLAVYMTASVSVALLFVGAVFAVDNSPYKNLEGTIDRSVFEVGQAVTITGTVNGDVFCAAQTVRIDATVNGDIICAGQVVSVQGKVSGDVRLMGQTVNVDADIAGSASVAGQGVVFASGSSVKQDVSVAGQTINVAGIIGRDLLAAGESVGVSSTTGRNVTAYADSLRLNSGAKIAGSLEYTSPNTVQQASDVTVAGQTNYHRVDQRPERERNAAGAYTFKLYWLIATVTLAIVLVAAFPGIFAKWNVTWPAGFWWAVLTGFVAMIALPIVTILLAITIIGVPVALLVILAWIMIALLSMPFAGYFVGRLIAPHHHPVVAVLVGVAALGIAGLLPLVGWIVDLFAFWLGFGMVLTGLKNGYKRPVYSNK